MSVFFSEVSLKGKKEAKPKMGPKTKEKIITLNALRSSTHLCNLFERRRF